MATLHVAKTGNDSNDGSEGSPFLTINAAMLAASAGDTISIGAGTYDETIKSQSGISNLSGRIPQHFVGATGNPEDVIVTNDSTTGGHGVVSVSSQGSVSNITCVYTGTSNTIAAASSTTPSPQGATWTNCIMKSNTIGFEIFGANVTIDRCTLISTHEGTSQVGTGIEGIAGGATNPIIKSCLVQNFNTDGIDLSGRGPVMNCTVQTNFRRSAGRGIYADNVFNSIFHNNSGEDLTVGIRGDTAVKHCISYGVDGDDDFTGTETNCHGFSDVTSSGFTLPFHDEAGGNFKPTAGSRAVAGGTNSTGSVHLDTDRVGRTMDATNPPIGCFVYAWPAGKLGTVSGGSIAKINDVAVTSIVKVSGT